MSEKAEIGRRLKEFQGKKFKSISEFAIALGLNNRTQVYDYINGKSYIGGEKLSQLAKLGCDINWLLTGEEKLIVKEKRVDYFGYSEDETGKKLTEHLLKYTTMLEEKVKALELQITGLEIKLFNKKNETAEVKK